MPTTNRPFFSGFFAAFRQHPQLPKASPASASVLGNSNAPSYLPPTSPLPATSAPLNTPTPTSSNRLSITTFPGDPLPTSEPPSPALLPLNPNAATIAAAQAAAASFRSSRPVHLPSGPIPTAQTRSRSTSRTSHRQQQQRYHHQQAASPLPLALPMPVPLPSGSHSSASSSLSASPTLSSPQLPYYPANVPPAPTGYHPTLPMSHPNPFAARSRTPSLTRTSTRQRRGSDSSTEGWAIGSYGAAGVSSGAGPAMASTSAAAAAAEKWYVGGRTAGGEERFYKLGLVRRYNSTDRLSLDRLSL